MPDNPPLVLDVDTGTASLPALSRGTSRIVGAGGRAAVVLAWSVWKRADLYSVRGRDARLSPLGTGANVWPTDDGRAVWIQNVLSRSRCTVRKMGLDGRQLRAPRPFPCATVSDPAAGSLGLVPGAHASWIRARVASCSRCAGASWQEPERSSYSRGREQLTLLDAETGAQRRLPRPSTAWDGQPAVDPRGRFVALVYGTPTWNTSTLPKGWKGGPLQVLHVWILDTRTGRSPSFLGMPAFMTIKRSDVAWTDDGRLVLFGHTATQRTLSPSGDPVSGVSPSKPCSSRSATAAADRSRS